MNPLRKRALTGGVVVATLAAIAVPLMSAAPAFADGSLQGAATIKAAGGASNLQSGDGATNFTLRLPTGASCPGDSANSGYRWQTYMVSDAIDPATLQFSSTGPTGASTGNHATFKQPLFDTSSTPIVQQQTANQTTANGPGAIINIPDMNFQVFTAGQIPDGTYNIGIACTLGGPSSTQMSSYWNTTITVATAAPGTGGNAQINWAAGNGAAPANPTITSATAAPDVPATGKITVAFTTGTSVPNPTSCTFFVGTTSGGTEFSGPGGISRTCSSPQDITGLSYGTTYFVRMTATNSQGTSSPSNEMSATPVRPAVTCTGGSGCPITTPAPPNGVALDWNDAPFLNGDQYNIDVCTSPATSPCLPASAGHVTTGHSATSDFTFTPATPGQVYAFTVTYGAPGTSLGASNTGQSATVPTLTTQTPGSVSVGSPTNDSATLSGGNNPTGTITFSLTDPSNAIVYTDVVTVSGNGTYSTAAMGDNPGGFTPATLGTYQWVAAYSGDALNTPVSTSPGDEPVTAGCDQTLQPTSGSVTLGSGTTCVSGITINGNLKVPKGASVVLIDSTITGSLTASGAKAVTVCNTTVDKSVRITGATGFVLLGDPGDDNCDPNTFSKVTLSKNAGGVELGQNTITGNVTVSRNTGSGPFAEDQGLELEGNSIGGKLSCTDNAPLSNGGRANSVTGTRKGQDCASPGF